MKRAIIAALAAAFLSTMAHGQETYRPTVPLMLPATDSFLQSFVRLINKSNQAGEVRITAVDDGGTVYDTVTVQLAALQTFHFNSGDLTDGNANKGISEGIGSPRQGNWRLQIETNLDVEALSFTRARDGFLTATHELLPEGDDGYLVKIFNPASNTTQQSRLRLINWGSDNETVRINAVDDGGNRRGPVSLTLPAGQSRTLTAVDLEEGAEGLEGSLGDGRGKWQLNVRGNVRSIVAQSLLYASSGHISNLSAEGFAAEEIDSGGGTMIYSALAVGNKPGRGITFGPVDEIHFIAGEFDYWHLGKVYSATGENGVTWVDTHFEINDPLEGSFDYATTEAAADEQALNQCKEGTLQGGFGVAGENCRVTARLRSGQCLVYSELDNASFGGTNAFWVVVPDVERYARGAAAALRGFNMNICERVQEREGRNATGCGNHNVVYIACAEADRPGKYPWRTSSCSTFFDKDGPHCWETMEIN